MLEKKISNLLRRLLPIDRYIFHKINRQLKLGLDYSVNKDAVTLLESIFIQREYADYFPFYKKATVLDIGAHYGYFTLFTLLNTVPHSTIFTLEPSPNNFKVLQQNLSKHRHSNIHCLPLAIAQTSTPQQLYTSHSYNHSLFPNVDQVLTTEVEGISLSDLFKRYSLEKVDFMKMDCEGAEYPALLHCGKEVLDKITTIFLEFHDLRNEGFSPDRLASHLVKHGFRIVRFSHDPDYSISNLNFGKLIATKKYL